jgi:glutaredoxin
MTVTLFKTPTCPQCKILKAKMDKKGIQYTEISDEDILRANNIHSVPQLKVDDTIYSNMISANKWIEAQEAKI